MSHWLVLSILFYCASIVLLENTGSGAEGNLRLCIVEGRGSYKRGDKYCPILDKENSGIECVIGVDRLDCLRRISKGTVDFGAFSPEDLIAAQWANIDVLVTNELRQMNRPFARSVAAVVHRSILDGAGDSSVSAILRNRTLCHPATDVDDLQPLSETLTKYVESLVTVDACDPNLSLVENRIKATADYFGIACMAGAWVPDSTRDAELKRRYPTLCQACSTGKCLKTDEYWGDSGALNCIGEGIGDITWAKLDDVRAYARAQAIHSELFAFLCRNGSSMPLDSPDPCVWLHRPWNVIVAKRKTADAVSRVTASLTDSAVTVDRHWRGALAALLEVRQGLPAPLQPPTPPMDFLASATGFREAYSQHGCNPPRHITLCTTSILENNKCEWLSEAGAVHGTAPPLQCARRRSVRECMAAVRQGQADAVVASGDWLVPAQRNYSLTPLLHEATPIIDKMSTVSAYVRVNSNIDSIVELRGRRAAFPSFDGFAWHSVFRYLTKKEKLPCKNIANTYFGSICAPGIEKHNVSEKLIEKFTKNCYKNGEDILVGEEQALRSLIEGNADVAFLNRTTFNLYMSKHIPKPWAKNGVAIKPVCPEENAKYCFISWSNIGHLFTSNNLTAMRRHEIINTLTNLDQLFGNHAHRLMFSMYGSFQHELDVLFHNNTRLLITDEMFNVRPYKEIPLNFEKSLNDTNICIYSDFTTDSGVKATPMILLLISLVFSLVLVRRFVLNV